MNFKLKFIPFIVRPNGIEMIFMKPVSDIQLLDNSNHLIIGNRMFLVSGLNFF